MKDRYNRDRGARVQLTTDMIEGIRELVRKYQVTDSDLARAFGVNPVTIVRAVSGITRGNAPIARHRGLTPEELTRAVEMAGEGVAVGQIALRLGRAWSTVGASLKRAGVAVSVRRYQRFTEEELDLAESMLEEGETLHAVAVSMGRDATPLGVALRKRETERASIVL